MERRTEDPDTLAQLFRLDHLTTRMRRQSEGLIILSGAAPGRRWNKPVPVIEVLRGATGEIEDYVRVDLVAESDDLVAGTAVADLTHLLAELIENAVLYSPPNTRVQVKTGWGGASGFIVEIDDRGLGIPAATMDELNRRLPQPPEFNLADSDQLGLLVVSRLAERHGIKVTLRASPYGGVAAIVLIPKELVVPAGMGAGRGELTAYSGTVPWPDPAAGPAPARPHRLRRPHRPARQRSPGHARARPVAAAVPAAHHGGRPGLGHRDPARPSPGPAVRPDQRQAGDGARAGAGRAAQRHRPAAEGAGWAARPVTQA